VRYEMSGLKQNEPALRIMGTTSEGAVIKNFAITPDEIDRYEVYTIINPSTNEAFVGTCAVAGTAATGALVLRSEILDYPRNLECVMLGTAAGMDGTMTVNGKDQFGVSITEAFAIANAENGGTTAGTKIFSSVQSGTFAFGTAIGNGTVSLGVGTTGTTALFGLPFKIGGTTDVKLYNYTAGTGAIAINGGTIAAFVGTQYHHIKAPADIVGTTSYQVWAKPTYNSEEEGLVCGMTHQT